MAESALELSIVMPCLNEAQTLPICLKKARDFLDKHHIHGEVIVADNGSHDESRDIATSFGARVVEVSEPGYGAALAGGIAAAQGRYVVMGDADDSYDFLELWPFLEQLRAGCDLVVGNRFKGGIKPGAMPFLNRYLGNPVLSGLGRKFFHIAIGDFHCGLRGFRRQAILDLGLRTTGMEYASEMIIAASMHNLDIKEVPVTLSPDGRGRRSHLRPWRDGWRHLRFMLLYSPRWLYLYPGLAALLFGFSLMAALLPGPVTLVKGLSLDVHSLVVGAISAIIGIQGISFGVIAEIYALYNIPNVRKTGVSRFVNDMTMDKLLIFGILSCFFGFIIIGVSVYTWSKTGFGSLSQAGLMRPLAVAATAIVAGLQLCFTAFFVGIMHIKRRQPV